MNLTERLLLLGTGIGITYTWLRGNAWVLPALRRCWHWWRQIAPGARNARLLTEIVKELHPNGGSSMRDSIIRIEERLARTHRAAKITLRMQRLHDEHAGLCSFLADEKGNCTYTNLHYQELVGLSGEEVLRNGWKNVIAQEDRAEVQAEWTSAVAERRDFHMSFNYFNHQTLTKIPCRVDAFCVEDDGILIGWIGYVHPYNGRRISDTHGTHPGRRAADRSCPMCNPEN